MKYVLNRQTRAIELGPVTKAAPATQPAPGTPRRNKTVEIYTKNRKNWDERQNRSVAPESPSPISGFEKCPKCGRYPRLGEPALYINRIPNWHEHCRPTAI
jgi:hypothetical protein